MFAGKLYNPGMKRIALALLVAGVLLAKNPPSGKASDASVEIAAVLFDADATKQAVGSDFTQTYTWSSEGNNGHAERRQISGPAARRFSPAYFLEQR